MRVAAKMNSIPATKKSGTKSGPGRKWSFWRNSDPEESAKQKKVTEGASEALPASGRYVKDSAGNCLRKAAASD